LSVSSALSCPAGHHLETSLPPTVDSLLLGGDAGGVIGASRLFWRSSWELSMRYFLWASAILCGLFLLWVPFCPAADEPVVPDEAPELPGPFFPYNVTGKKAGYYHCLVTQHHLDPAVLIFVREAALKEGGKPGAPLNDLLKKLDQRVEKNIHVRLAVFVVILMEDNNKGNVTMDDDKRDQMDEMVKKWAEEQALTHTVFCLDSPSRLKAYDLKNDKDLTFILFRRYKVLARHDWSLNELTAEKAGDILTEVKDKLAAPRQ
jgi:hypothetical protein